MSKLIKEMKEYTNADNGTGGFTYPIGVDAKNVLLKDGYYLEDALGQIDFFNKGSIMQQLKETTQAAADSSVPPNATITTPTINNATIAGSNTSISEATLNNCIIKPKLIVKNNSNTIIGQIDDQGYKGVIYGGTNTWIRGGLHLKTTTDKQYGTIGGGLPTNVTDINKGYLGIYFPTTGDSGTANGYFAISGRKRNSSGEVTANYLELVMTRTDTTIHTNVQLGSLAGESSKNTNLSVSGALTISGATTLKGALKVSGKTDLVDISSTGTLTIGNSTLKSTLTNKALTTQNALIENLFVTKKGGIAPITVKTIASLRAILKDDKNYPPGAYPIIYDSVLHHYIKYKQDYSKTPSKVTVGPFIGIIFKDAGTGIAYGTDSTPHLRNPNLIMHAINQSVSTYSNLGVTVTKSF